MTHLLPHLSFDPDSYDSFLSSYCFASFDPYTASSCGRIPAVPTQHSTLPSITIYRYTLPTCRWTNTFPLIGDCISTMLRCGKWDFVYIYPCTLPCTITKFKFKFYVSLSLSSSPRPVKG